MLKYLFVLQALVDVLYGLPLILATGTLLSIYGLNTDRSGTYLAQFLGGTLIALAWISWFARNLPDGEARRMIVRASFIGTGIGFLVSLNNQLQPGASALAWTIVGLTLIFWAAWGYFSYATMRSVTRQQPA